MDLVFVHVKIKKYMFRSYSTLFMDTEVISVPTCGAYFNVDVHSDPFMLPFTVHVNLLKIRNVACSSLCAASPDVQFSIILNKIKI